jgi:hypothetical protein
MKKTRLFLLVPSADRSEDASAHYLVADPDTTQALDAPVGVFHYYGAEHIIFLVEAVLGLAIPARGRAVLIDHILQLALAAFIADRTIHGMVGEEELQNALARLLYLRALGLYAHTLDNRGNARWLEFFLPLNLYKAHPARTHAHEIRLIAEGRYIYTCVPGGIKY